MDRIWYKRWFGETYKKLYPHRDFKEAEAQVRFVLRELPVTPEWRILDIGCGPGRHLEILRKRGHARSVGLDLSLPLLLDARAAGLMVARGDMRHLPFRSAGFDLVTSFFTSFGYFATFEEDVETLAQFVSVLKPGGFLFLDLINKGHLIKHLVPHDLRVLEGSEVEQRRRLEGPVSGPGAVVIKEIEIRRPGGEVEHYQERVRLYEYDAALALAARFSLRHVATFGDETGAAYHPEESPRMALLLQATVP
ncbi:MAG TPA: class I SAM-dependent methyltransferase [Fibrobacteria bacterium]|nr:class I SAM-dependent methyltransferase [Fibrobacteria bacterium]